MAVVINGSGTVTGLAVGGLPDGTVDAGTLATNSVDSAELIDGAVDAAHLASGVGGKIKYVGTSTLAAAANLTSTATAWTSTGATITVAAADVVGLSKIILISNGSIRVNKSTHAFADVRWQRTAPSTANFEQVEVGVVAGGTEVYHQAGSIAVDSSLGVGDHTYTMYFRKAAGSGSYADDIYYNYFGWRMIAIGV